MASSTPSCVCVYIYIYTHTHEGVDDAMWKASRKKEEKKASSKHKNLEFFLILVNK